VPVRYPDYESFWPYYISEHKLPITRAVHFVGTSGFVAVVAWCALTSPLTFIPLFGASLGLGRAFFHTESERAATPVLLAMVALGALGHPGLLLGVVFAYACAWVGHFLIEHNRPATFTYPLWSLASDFRMYGEMWRGRLWVGDGSREVGEARPPEAFHESAAR